MGKIYKWGIIGPGKIAQKFAAAIRAVPNATLHAVASRDGERAKQFAATYNAPVFYNNYEALTHDSEIDAVYIATPHTYHHAHTLLCLQQKKAVLCEKPMSLSYASTAEMISEAKKNNVFLMEAMWSRFLPIINKTLELIKQGEIGELKYLSADFGFVAPYDENSRLYDLSLGGGSLPDVGIYPLFLALLVMGKPEEIKSFAHLAKTGADETTSAIFCYKNGSMANIVSSIVSQTPITAEITGTKGTIILDRPWYKGNNIRIRKDDIFDSAIDVSYPGNGFEFQIEELQNCLQNGLQESTLMPLDFSLDMSFVMEKILTMNNIHYKIQAQ